jgi:hypothetical protein
VPFRDAVARLAAAAGGSIREVDGVLVVRAGAGGLPWQRRVTLHTQAVDVRAFALALCTQAGVDLVVAGDVQGRVRCDLEQASWRDALDVAADGLGAEVVGCGAVLLLRPRAANATAPPRVRFAYAGLPSATIVDAIARIGGLNVVASPGLAGRLIVAAVGVEPGAVLAAVALAAGAEHVEEDRGIHRLVVDVPTAAPAPPAAQFAAKDLTLATFADLLEASTRVRVAVPAAEGRTLSVFARAAAVRDLARAAARATGRRLTCDGDGPLRIQ